MFVSMGSTADAVSYEASQYEQGLLTYSLLEGMKGTALRKDQYVDVNGLFQRAVEEVPELAKGIDGIKKPRIASRGGNRLQLLAPLVEAHRPYPEFALTQRHFHKSPCVRRPFVEISGNSVSSSPLAPLPETVPISVCQFKGSLHEKIRFWHTFGTGRTCFRAGHEVGQSITNLPEELRRNGEPHESYADSARL